MSIVKDAYVIYDENFLSKEDADRYFTICNETFDFKYNSYHETKLQRQTCAFIDKDLMKNIEKIPKIWGEDITVKEFTPELLEIKTKIENKVKELTGQSWKYNVILCNKYVKNKDVIHFHSDKEEQGITKSIASISLGIRRTFIYKSKGTDEKVSLSLNHGSLIFMGDNCQENYLHGMKREDTSLINTEDEINKYNNTRINLTFRVFDYN